jgi:hypothetical protein
MILHTSNGGANWVSLNSNTNNTLRSVYFPAGNVGYAVGHNGTIRKTTTGFVAVEPVSSVIPDNFSLGQNYPNPFNPASKIRFDIPSASVTKLVVFDASGREAGTLINQQLSAGTYEIDFNGANLSSGVYFYRLTAGEFTATRKMILTK